MRIHRPLLEEFGSGDKSVFGVVVDETLDSRTDSHLGHDITSGHEDSHAGKLSLAEYRELFIV